MSEYHGDEDEQQDIDDQLKELLYDERSDEECQR